MHILSDWIEKERNGINIWIRMVTNTLDKGFCPCKIDDYLYENGGNHFYIGYLYDINFLIYNTKGLYNTSEVIKDPDLDVLKFKVDLYLINQGYIIQDFF